MLLWIRQAHVDSEIMCQRSGQMRLRSDMLLWAQRDQEQREAINELYQLWYSLTIPPEPDKPAVSVTVCKTSTWSNLWHMTSCSPSAVRLTLQTEDLRFTLQTSDHINISIAQKCIFLLSLNKSELFILTIWASKNTFHFQTDYYLYIRLYRVKIIKSQTAGRL